MRVFLQGRSTRRGSDGAASGAPGGKYGVGGG